MSKRDPNDGSVRVALVDDDESICRSFSRCLRAAGFQAVSYASGEAFLEDDRNSRFDCLVLDIQLEGMSGLELSRRLAAAKHAVPVIFITAHDEPEMRAQALDCGGVGFFRKSDPGHLVMEAIRQAVQRHPDPRSSPLQRPPLSDP